MRRLSPNQQVSVSLPTTFGRHVDVLDFRVVAVIDTVIALEPMVRADTRLIPDRVPDCYLSFGYNNGLVGLKGHLYERAPGDWRFKVTDQAAFPPETPFRIKVCAPITVASDDEAIAPLEVETVSVGADGLLADCGEQEPPEFVHLTLSLPGEDEPIETPARLIARQGTLSHYRYGAMDPATRNRVGCFVIEYQRDAMRRRLAWYRAEVVGLDDDLDF
jgi:hypothetical protein